MPRHLKEQKSSGVKSDSEVLKIHIMKNCEFSDKPSV